MTDRVLSALTRILDDAGEAMRTPSVVNVDLLRSYGRHHKNALPHYSGNEIPSRRDG
ncbi:MAG: hypothetical protein ABR941_05195 [Thermoleophilia bacterium]|jgi:hypothetical protein